MASDIHSITLTGRLGGEPEFKKVGDTDLAEFSVAVTQYRGPNREADTAWWRCQLWGGRSKVAEWLKTGMKVTIKGDAMVDTYTKDGKKRFAHYIDVRDIVLPDKSDQTGGEKARSRASRSRTTEPGPQDPDDDLPF